MNEGLSYSFHLGSDKNKKANVRNKAKENASGTTSLSNNAIQNIKQLGKVNHHNLRKYDNQLELINTIKGTNDIINDVKDLYLELFEEAKLEYNNKQKRDDRKIENYFDKISNDTKHDLACEIIIELGDMKYWENKSKKDKLKMVDVFKDQIIDLEKVVPNFKVANATIHFDESSPHLHIIGVPYKDNCKTGLSRQVGKSDVFTKESLTIIQDKMRVYCINSFNKVYSLKEELKEKQQGRNRDINVKDMGNYQRMKKQLNQDKDKLDKANKKSLELDNKSNNIKEQINNLKISKLNKDNLILSKEDKEKLIKYIDEVEKTNNDFKSIHKLSITLNDVDTELKENKKNIAKLEKENYKLKQTIKDLNYQINEDKEEISKLKSTINNLKQTISYLKDKFDKLISFLHSKIHNWYDKDDKYLNVINDMYKDEVLDDEDIDDIGLNTKKDDFEI
jgi:plasmid recombination enzyme